MFLSDPVSDLQIASLPRTFRHLDDAVDLGDLRRVCRPTRFESSATLQTNSNILGLGDLRASCKNAPLEYYTSYTMTCAPAGME